MKGVLSLILVLGLASMANAALSLTVDGQSPAEITIDLSDTIAIGIYNSVSQGTICYLDFCYKSQGRYSLGNPRVPYAYTPEDPPFYWYTYDDCDEFYVELVSAYSPGIGFEVDLTCENLGDVYVALMDYEFTVIDTMTVHQVSALNPADVDEDGDVDFADFEILASQWQDEPGIPSADIAPPGGDGIVDELDLDVLCDNWLAGK